MGKVVGVLVLCGVAFGAGAYLAFHHFRPAPEVLPDPPALVTQLQDVARLETLEVNLYKKVSFEPDPRPADSLWGDVVGWVKSNINPPRGKAIVFAVAHVGLDVTQLDSTTMRARGTRIDLVLPPLKTQVELKPGETEVIGSNLDSQQTAELFERAKAAFQREVEADAGVRERARSSARRALEGLLLNAGFREVHFVDQLPPEVGS